METKLKKIFYYVSKYGNGHWNEICGIVLRMSKASCKLLTSAFAMFSPHIVIMQHLFIIAQKTTTINQIML